MSSPAEIPDDMWAHPTLKKDVYKKKVKFCKKDCREKLCKSTVAKLFITNVSIDTFVAFININTVCFACVIVAFWMSKFVEENRAKYLEALHLYLRSGPDVFPVLSKPKHLADGKLVNKSFFFLFMYNMILE